TVRFRTAPVSSSIWLKPAIRARPTITPIRSRASRCPTFLTPPFYDPMLTQGPRYSFTGALKKPREILPGGYISWINPAAEEVQQLQYVDPNQPPTIVNLGPASGASLREFIDSKSRPT